MSSAHLLSALCLKNDSPLACYNFDIHQLILIIFGRNFAKKISSQIMLYFHITKLVILHYLGKRKTRKLRLYLNAVCCFANNHKKPVQIITCHSRTIPHLQNNKLYSPNKNLGRHTNHLLLYTSHLPSLSWCWSLCQKLELFFVRPGVKSMWTVLAGYLYYFNLERASTSTRTRWHFAFGTMLS